MNPTLAPPAAARTTTTLFASISRDLEETERLLRQTFDRRRPGIDRLLQHLNHYKGKRLRPALLLLTAQACGKITPAHHLLAAVVEMIHTATLVHDDIIDVAETRRGKPSTNILFGNHTSVLAGDWLYMQAFQIALRERNFHVLDILIALTQMMVEGELIQLDRIGKIDITEADYMELVDRKTAGLFAACARLGAVIAGSSDESETRLADYAWNLGMAFQLIDDVLDFTAQEKVLGKPVGGDLREGKVTLPLIYALQECTSGERGLIETILRDRSYDSVPFRAVLEMICRHNGVGKARERAHSFAERARVLIGEFPDGPYQRALSAVTDLVTERTF